MGGVRARGEHGLSQNINTYYCESIAAILLLSRPRVGNTIDVALPEEGVTLPR